MRIVSILSINKQVAPPELCYNSSIHVTTNRSLLRSFGSLVNLRKGNLWIVIGI